MIQVSLLPPPCEEFTTNQPSVNATRVNPPGTISTPLGPHKAYGLKSTWRNFNWPSIKQGTVLS